MIAGSVVRVVAPGHWHGKRATVIGRWLGSVRVEIRDRLGVWALPFRDTELARVVRRQRRS